LQYLTTCAERRSSAVVCGLGVMLLVAAPLAARVDAEPPPAPTPAGDADDLAQKLANPVSNLISVPLQSNFDFDAGGDEDGFRYTLNVQPVIPFSLGADWNLITRTIVPLVAQNDAFSALTNGDEIGLGDVVASGFFSPKQSTPISETANLTWGVGPVVYLPTATERTRKAAAFSGRCEFGSTASRPARIQRISATSSCRRPLPRQPPADGDRCGGGWHASSPSSGRLPTPA
jgi:hypothetical protein